MAFSLRWRLNNTIIKDERLFRNPTDN